MSGFGKRKKQQTATAKSVKNFQQSSSSTTTVQATAPFQGIKDYIYLIMNLFGALYVSTLKKLSSSKILSKALNLRQIEEDEPIPTAVLLASHVQPEQRPLVENVVASKEETKLTPAPVAAKIPTGGKLYRFQKDLPKLPVPSLAETAATYLKTVRPLVEDAEYEATVKAVEEFLLPGGKGEELQQRLIEHDNKKTTSWLIDWWNSYAYMGYRDPVVVFVNYFFCFNDDKKLIDKPAARAAEIITGAMEFRRLVVTEELEPDMARKAPLCVHQYKYLFNSTRIPKPIEDGTRNSNPATNNHIVVIRKNKFFIVELVINGRQLSTAEIESQIEAIYKLAGTDKDAPIGSLTTQDRDTWTQVRNDLLAISPKNRSSLDRIETAAFAVCLDDTKPVTYDQRAKSCWVGDGRNRFFDKSVQLIVFDNGVAGFNGEHSMMDATPTSRMCDFILDSLEKGKLNHGTPSGAKLSPPKKLEFELNDSLHKEIEIAQQKFDELVEKHDLKVVVFEGYGKNLIKKLGCSPDAYAQMAIQLAYYKTYGTCVATYESAQTKKYAYGRTETGRSVSVESVAWVKAMQNNDLSAEEKGALGRKAVASQSSYMALAADGRGVDRHLLGLRLLIKPKEEKPEIFKDPSYALSSHWTLSTSQITSEHFVGYGWGQVVPDGYGVAYMVKNDSLQFNLVSLKLQNDIMHYNFMEALREMKVVFEATIPPPRPAPAAATAA
ncbi:UNVERIFIED_CONTAM: Carnitine O-acetyltransferase mitochondrial [Siphonaria sp. JEL0065]|nr:Carnitine O-acetyltransferase mitochondrial [Siphonaria sp. JEL0065]